MGLNITKSGPCNPFPRAWRRHWFNYSTNSQQTYEYKKSNIFSLAMSMLIDIEHAELCRLLRASYSTITMAYCMCIAAWVNPARYQLLGMTNE